MALTTLHSVLVDEVDQLLGHGVQRDTACAMVADRFGVSDPWLDDVHWTHMLENFDMVALDRSTEDC